MALFEEPLAGHTRPTNTGGQADPVLIFSFEMDHEGKPYAFICNAEGELFKVSFDLITVDWRWLPKDERWYDLVDIAAMAQAKEGGDDGAADEPSAT